MWELEGWNYKELLLFLFPCLNSLKKLLLSNTKVTDEGMMHLKGLTKLEVLYLDRTQVSDPGASIIKG